MAPIPPLGLPEVDDCFCALLLNIEADSPLPYASGSLTIDGSDQVTFSCFNGPTPMHYVMGLMPAAEPI